MDKKAFQTYCSANYFANKCLLSFSKKQFAYLDELLSSFDGADEFEFNQWICNEFSPVVAIKHNQACRVQSLVAEFLAHSSRSSAIIG